ncbi:hypothetical protein OIV83_000183 [Microbotryomycetes sp. JL201]|nr:hypothetical protein OIV83_000183 [Microbotryomycetes sp. JL201]
MLKLTRNGRPDTEKQGSPEEVIPTGEQSLQLEHAERLYDEAHEERMRKKEERIQHLESLLASLETRAERAVGLSHSTSIAALSDITGSNDLYSVDALQGRHTSREESIFPSSLKAALDMLPLAHSGASLAGYRRRRQSSQTVKSDGSEESRRSKTSGKGLSSSVSDRSTHSTSLTAKIDVQKPSAGTCPMSNRNRTETDGVPSQAGKSRTKAANDRTRRSPIQLSSALASAQAAPEPRVPQMPSTTRPSPISSPRSPKSVASLSPSTAPEMLFVPSHYATAFASQQVPLATASSTQPQTFLAAPGEVTQYQQPTSSPWPEAEQNMWNVTPGGTFEPYYVPAMIDQTRAHLAGHASGNGLYSGYPAPMDYEIGMHPTPSPSFRGIALDWQPIAQQHAAFTEPVGTKPIDNVQSQINPYTYLKLLPARARPANASDTPIEQLYEPRNA